jgi:hypothetical protein
MTPFKKLMYRVNDKGVLYENRDKRVTKSLRRYANRVIRRALLNEAKDYS